MHIHHKHAEIFCYDMLSAIRVEKHKWRSIFLRFSMLDEAYKEGFRTHVVVNILRELLHNEEGFVYLCDDGDVVFLFEGSVSRIIQKLDRYAQDLFPEPLEKSTGQPWCGVYDLGREWDALFPVVEQKRNLAIGKDTESKNPHATPSGNKNFTPNKKVLEMSIAERSKRSRMLVLLVEDDAFTRRLVASSLKPGCDVLEAGDGKQALQLYVEHAPDLVFLDINLPDTNGHSLLQQMIAMDAAAFLVMLSANRAFSI